MNLDFIKKLLYISIILSVITCAFIQKTKGMLKKSSHINIYSLFVNVILSIFFCRTFTDVNFPVSLWCGLFAYLGADTLYKSLEGKLKQYSDIIDEDITIINREE